MNAIAEMYAAIERQENPEYYKNNLLSTEDIVTCCFAAYMRRSGYCLPAEFIDSKHLEEDSVPLIERAKEQGYEPIVNDGKLLGFKKAL